MTKPYKGKQMVTVKAESEYLDIITIVKHLTEAQQRDFMNYIIHYEPYPPIEELEENDK